MHISTPGVVAVFILYSDYMVALETFSISRFIKFNLLPFYESQGNNSLIDKRGGFIMQLCKKENDTLDKEYSFL